MKDDPGFERWIDSHGYRTYVAMCAGGTLGMAAPGILELHKVYERERLAERIPVLVLGDG